VLDVVANKFTTPKEDATLWRTDSCAFGPGNLFPVGMLF
jgi:hypothetical protein